MVNAVVRRTQAIIAWRWPIAPHLDNDLLLCLPWLINGSSINFFSTLGWG
jgi:hypothetical protein